MLDALGDAPLPLHKSAGRDLIDGAQRVNLWARLGWMEVKRRYRHTVIGPFWSVVSLATFVATMGTASVTRTRSTGPSVASRAPPRGAGLAGTRGVRSPSIRAGP